ncbi:MAG: S-layer homology domain-containing protein [Firmicutes bacterium]|nr:S-layer homology domain-containing protein [Bacillota bacterium]
MLRKFSAILMTFIIAASGVIYSSASSTSEDWTEEYSWAVDGVNYCMTNGILTGDDFGNLNLADNLTRAQMAKMLCETFDIAQSGETEFTDIDGHWAYGYLAAIEDLFPVKSTICNPDEAVTREEFAALLVRASGLSASNIRNSKILDANFYDAADVGSEYKTYLCIAVERAYMKGSDGYIRPKDLLTRAEVAVLVQRVAQNNSGEITLTWEDLGVISSYTELIGEAQITVEQAQAWAEDKGAAQIFIDIAPTYWYYGELFGLRPEILYAQAAKETAYGNYGGAVLPEMNNWAGIKIKSPIGDRTEDHESFDTPEDGVRAHFNHMCAYVGLEPIGEVHDRYYVVASLSWAGTVKNLEALGGRWCPDLYYGYSILHDYIEEMSEY